MRRIGYNFALIATMGLAASEAFAQPGPYISQQLGVAFSPNLNIDADTNDPGSICDEFVNPFRDVMPAACQGMDAPRTEWMTPFMGGRGVVTSSAFGYRFGRFRTEVEYFFNDASHNDTADIMGRGAVALTKLGSEVVLAEDRLGNVQAHNVFGNFMMDFPNTSRVTPYVGAGAGVSYARMHYGLLWVRNSDPSTITSVAEYFPEDRMDDLMTVQRNLAGTVSSEQVDATDTVRSYQVVFGADIAVSHAVSLGVKARYVKFGEFMYTGDLDLLRSHETSNHLDGSSLIQHRVVTSGLSLLGVGMNLTYRF